MDNIKQISIAVVDDEPAITMLIKMILGKFGYENIVCFNNPVEAKLHIFNARPEIVCTDIRMPELSGIDLLNEIKSNTPDIPVIMISASSEFDDVLSCLKLGAYDFITKPIKKEALANVINKAAEIITLRKNNKLYLEQLAENNRMLTQFSNKMKSELKLAQELQMKFTPKLANKLGDYEIFFDRKYSTQIGGDFIASYEFSRENKFAVILADMPGHGIPAALILTAFKVICNDALRSEKSSGEILSQINSAFMTLKLSSYPSVCCIIIDNDKKIFEYSNAGHPYPFIISSNKSIRTIEENQILLGVMEIEYNTNIIELKKGETMYMYSDGVIEIPQAALSRSEKSEISRDDEDEYNILNLADFIIRNEHLGIQNIFDRIYNNIVSLKSVTEVEDDIMLLAVSLK